MGTTTLTTIQINWVALTGDDTGGTNIDSYEVSYGSGVSGSTWNVAQGGEGSYSTTLTFSID